MIKSDMVIKMKKKSNGFAFGAIIVALAYAMWGSLTLFWNLLNKVNPVFILSQRIIWSMVFMAVFLLITGGFGEIKRIFKDKRSLLLCFVCGVLVTVNWGVYIYAVNSSHVLDASLGYFIEPVMVALIGIIAFKEKPSLLEKITYAFAFAALAYIIIATKTVPLLSLVISGSFAVYGAVKKKLTITPGASLFMETLLMTPFALAFAGYAQTHGMGTVGVLNGAWLLLLPACGVITSVPLLMFNVGVRKIPYYFSGILMYINPTIQFLMGYFYFREPLDRNRLIAFVILWVGVVFTVIDKLIQWKKDSAKINA